MTDHQTLRCEEALRLLAQYLDRELDEHHSSAVEDHLATCRACFSRAEFEQRLRTQLATLRSVDVPQSLDRRIREVFGTSVLPNE